MIPDGYRECPDCRRWTKAAVCRCGRPLSALEAAAAPQATPRPRTAPTAAREARRRPAGPNKTEAEYRRLFLDPFYPPTQILYEGVTLRLANGHRYTPDWVVVFPGGEVELHEVKGAYKLGSYQRARLAFDQARVEFPHWRFVWAELGKEGWRKSEDRP